ncbi:MAG: hypothetical protein LBV12_12840 [Puniceicoccales bacterium]|jgi:hypothetical protein|nr:hypothetical protein [Puniceicoccales bacterium]
MRGGSSPFEYRCRGILFLTAVLFFSGLVCRGDDAPASEEIPSTKVSYVYTRWQEANDFKRISEYFTGQENKGGDIILRSDVAVRQGLYFRIGMPLGTKFPEHSKAVLEYIRGDDSQIHTQQFDLPEMPGGPFAEIRLGLTGKEWASKRLAMVAWRLTLRDDTGKLIAQTQSYLWGMPKDNSKNQKETLAEAEAPAVTEKQPAEEK